MVVETLDELRRYNLFIAQHRDGYRFSLDPFLLCDFVGGNGVDTVVDLGTGSGIMPMLLARKWNNANLVGVEVQELLAGIARRNVELNDLSNRISLVQADVCSLREHFAASSFDLVISNPPYRKRGTGRVSPKAGRDNARHESTANLADFLAIAKYLVKPSGRICFIYHPSRLPELFTEAAVLKLAPLRLRMVHGNWDAEARMFLIELAKGRRGELRVLPPLIVHDENGAYSAEMMRIYGD